MIPELLGEAIGIIGNGERSKQFSLNGALPRNIPTTSSASPSPCSSTVTTPTNSGSGPENLRCPRCDSTNTKFCYYNNYNLTQPRHFCKTCRRYWTKGGALRNVPIGGGCRKNRSPAMTTAAASGKFRAMATEMGMIKSGFMANYEQEYPSSLLKAGQNQNPNPSSAPISSSLFSHVKEEPAVFKSGQVMSSFSNMINTSSIWRENERQNNSGLFLGGAQDLYKRLGISSSANYGSAGNYYGNNINGLMGSSSSSSSLAMFESAPVAAAAAHDPMGCWNPVLSSWSDLPAAANGAYRS